MDDITKVKSSPDGVFQAMIDFTKIQPKVLNKGTELNKVFLQVLNKMYNRYPELRKRQEELPV